MKSASEALSWVDELPVDQALKEWVRLFVTHNYKTCISRGLELLPHIASFEMLQIFLICLQRCGTEPAGGGRNAVEVLEQVAPQALRLHEHNASLFTLLRVTLGICDAD